MFCAKERLSRAAFTTVFKSGVRYQTPALTLIYSPSPTRQVSVVVGKKVYKNAIDRNRLRRRLYDAIRRYFIAHAVVQGTFILITKPPAVAFTRLETGSAVADLLARTAKTR